MSDLGGFNANDVPENEGFETLPAGEYDAIIFSSETNATKSGKFIALKLNLQILNGQFQNRKLIDRLNFKREPSYQGVWTEKDDTTTRIGAGNLSSICRAINVLTPRDSSELHNKPLRIKVAIRESKEYGKQNEVKSYKPRNVGPSGPMLPMNPQAGSTPPQTDAEKFKAAETPWG